MRGAERSSCRLALGLIHFLLSVPRSPVAPAAMQREALYSSTYGKEQARVPHPAVIDHTDCAEVAFRGPE